MKTKRIKIILYVSIMVLILIYLFVIDDLLLIGHSQPQKIDESKIVRNPVISNLEKCYSMSDNLDEVYFQGWAFSDTDKPKLGIVLSGNKGGTFLCISGDTICRDDVYEYYSSQGRLIQGNNHGFMFSFSVLKLPDDNYNIGIYCYENPETYGVDWKDKILIKKGKAISITERTSTTQNITPTIISDALTKYNLDTVKVNEDNSATISGWAIGDNEDGDLAKQNIYILLVYEDGSSAAYDTWRIARADVAKAFSSDLYTMSGFRAEIPASLLQSTSFEPYIIIQGDRGWYTSPDMIETVQATFRQKK